MGEALARVLVSRGWSVALADLNRNTTLENDLGDNARFYPTNVASYDSQASTFRQVFHDFGRLDALCANAGIVDKGSRYLFRTRGAQLDDVPPAPDLSCTEIDWKGVVYGTQLCQHFMRFNRPTPGGVIVATASIAAVHPHESYPEYNGAKAAVLNWVRGTARLLKAKENIRINCVMPGIVDTPIVPREMIAAVQPEFVTPVTTITDAYVRLLEDEGLFGQAIEGSVKEQVFFETPKLGNGKATRRSSTVWEPLFEVLHGEVSGLEDAIPGKKLVWGKL